ncbi:MAG TPA: maleylpyruvate isomerase family mycothiol-dependent enzyme [Acidimicrobiales bacterium]|nr:maleylpyruvate isomerase family mycothiol-dependent enzyme [Acidimicrobiales bacterium]
MDVWEMTDGERRQIAARLAEMPEDAWGQPTLCEGWLVRDVVGHLIAIGSMSAGRFVRGMARNRFSFDSFQGEGIRTYASGKSPAEILRGFEATLSSRAKPPGPKTTVLGEVLVHGEDIFRAQSQGFGDHPAEHLVAAADFYKRNSFPLKVKRRIRGVTLRMTDADWSYGSGPEVAGPGISVLMAMVGRKIALSDLKGDGVAVLAARS